MAQFTARDPTNARDTSSATTPHFPWCSAGPGRARSHSPEGQFFRYGSRENPGCGMAAVCRSLTSFGRAFANVAGFSMV